MLIPNREKALQQLFTMHWMIVQLSFGGHNPPPGFEGVLVTKHVGRLNLRAGTMWRRPGQTYRTKPYYYIQADSIDILDRVTNVKLVAERSSAGRAGEGDRDAAK